MPCRAREVVNQSLSTRVRLLLHAAPMGPDAHRSFNFNKLRSFLISRELPSAELDLDSQPPVSRRTCSEARVGVELDSDQFVGPGVDYMLLACDSVQATALTLYSICI